MDENANQMLAVVGPALFCSQDQQKLKLKRDDQESVRNVQLKDANSAQVCVFVCARVQVGCVAPPSFCPCFPSEVAADDT